MVVKKEMIINTIKNIVTCTFFNNFFLTIYSIHTFRLLAFSLHVLSLQWMIRIYTAILDMKFDSVISAMPELKDSNS